MFAILGKCLLVFIGIAVTILPHGTAIETISANLNASCTPSQTPCALGCCPFTDGVCCADGFECCQSGQTCIPFVGICVGLDDSSGKTSLVSTKSTPIKSLITSCPPGTTTCGPDECCPFPHGTCCSDGLHCCPQGYRCDLPNKKCIKNSANDFYGKWNFKSETNGISLVKVTNKPAYKSCPGSGRVCPSYTSCCINDNGEWSCCPNPSLPQLSYGGGGECCDTIWGHMCCPDSFPICTVIGCTN